MKKIFCLVVALVFTISMMGTSFAVAAETTVSASGTTATVTVSGTTTETWLAVMITLCDTDGTTILRTQSAAVETDDTFSTTFKNLVLTAGATYTVKVTNFNGGSGWTKSTFKPTAIPVAPSTYKVTLTGNGGTGTDLASYTAGTAATLPTDWTRAGYTFAGWYDNAGFTGDAVTAIAATAAGDKSYFAKWTEMPPSLTAPTGLKAKATGQHAVLVSWTRSDGADYYKVYKSNAKAGKYYYAGKTSGASKSVKLDKAGTVYYFKVKAVNAEATAMSEVVSARTKKAPVTFSLSNIKGNNIRVAWKSVKGAKGYQIANSRAGSDMKVRWTGRNADNRYTSMSKVKGKTYKFKMRYYKIKDGKKVYSSWTGVQTIKVR